MLSRWDSASLVILLVATPMYGHSVPDVDFAMSTIDHDVHQKTLAHMCNCSIHNVSDALVRTFTYRICSHWANHVGFGILRRLPDVTISNFDDLPRPIIDVSLVLCLRCESWESHVRQHGFERCSISWSDRLFPNTVQNSTLAISHFETSIFHH